MLGSLGKAAWNFVKRHKKKFIASGVIVGGGYLAWKVWLPRLQQQLLQKLLADADLDGTLKKLTQAAGADASNSKQRRAGFKHKQKVSDGYVRKALTEVRQRHNALFRIDECRSRLQEPTLNKEVKAARFKELEVECIARSLSAAYALNTLMMLCRVEFNIIGREIATTTAGEAAAADPVASATEAVATAVECKEDADAHAAFIESTRHLEEHGIKQIAETIRQAVAARVESAEFFPQTLVTAESFEAFLLGVCADVDKETFRKSGGGVAALLPDGLDAEAGKDNQKVKALLDEARDYLESPQFLDALHHSIVATVRRLVGVLGDEAEDPTTAPLANGRSCAIGKLFGKLMELSNTVLSPDDKNDFFVQFSKESIVEELCQALYFQDDVPGDGNDVDPKCAQQ